MSEDALNAMTVGQLKLYIANFPDDLPVYVGTDDNVDDLTSVYVTNDCVILSSSDDEEILDAEFASFEEITPIPKAA